MAPWTCAKCGSVVADDRLICRSCGAPRALAPLVGRPDAPLVEPIPEAPSPAEEIPEVEPLSEDIPDEPDAPDVGGVSGEAWNCARCRKLIEPEFEVCWSCGTSKTFVVDPDFRRVEVTPTAPAESLPISDDLGPDPEDPSMPPGEPPDRTCPACGEALVPIQLIDTSGRYGGRQQELRYAAGEAKRGWLFGYPIEGVLRAQLCPRCGRVGLYAVPNA